MDEKSKKTCEIISVSFSLITSGSALTCLYKNDVSHHLVQVDVVIKGQHTGQP